MDISDRLRQARLAKELSQEELAKLAGVTQGTIANIENGHRKQPRGLLSIARALGIDPTYLLTGQASGFGAPPVHQEVREPTAPYATWPFRSITRTEWQSLPHDQRDLLEIQIRATIEHHSKLQRKVG